jgi:hypothetical protein
VSSSQSTATVPASNIDSASGERLLRLGNGERTERRQSLTPRQGDLAGRLAESGASRFDSDRVRRYIR